ncbi:MAG: hypothetical protein IJJ41_00075 [Clostridia bacterium]|nr:hypothetical protein [Clostridia bacterium]
MILKIALFACAAAIAALSLKKTNEHISLLMLMAATAAIAAFVIAGIVNAMGEMSEIFSFTGAGSAYFAIILKCLGMSFVAQLAADICADAGYNSLSAQMIFAGKMAILLLSLPLFKAVLEVSIGLIQS